MRDQRRPIAPRSDSGDHRGGQDRGADRLRGPVPADRIERDRRRAAADPVLPAGRHGKPRHGIEDGGRFVGQNDARGDVPAAVARFVQRQPDRQQRAGARAARNQEQPAGVERFDPAIARVTV
ncbi:hypothetical protein LTR94_032268, partial [Friedmanniomyces endolithicus]